MTIQRVKSKWAKTKVLLRSSEVRAYIPHTKPFSRDGLRSMLEKYDILYVKPVVGTHGKGVIRVEQVREAFVKYRFHYKTTPETVNSFDELYVRLKRQMGNRSYLIQKGIDLLRYDRRRFDIRVMVQKNLNNKWETTGIIGRLSHPSKIVTNYSNGGTLMTFERLMSRHCSDSQIKSYVTRLRRIGVAAANQLETAYPNLKELGVDVAIDTKLNPWILEVNTLPHPYVFKKLADTSVFRKIYRYGVAYGRFKAKKN